MVQEKYRLVSQHPTGHFRYPTGRESTVQLGYLPEWLEAVPPEVVDRFVGVGNPFSVRKPTAGTGVLDVGCGCGLDAFVAAGLVGPEGRAVGLDLSADMLRPAQEALATSRVRNLGFERGSVEVLPFEDASFDLVISNGAMNLVPDKDAAFREIHRVLKPGGTLAVADLLVVETIPEEVLADTDAWST
jgi:SAM-dependent methyltransferase